MKGTVTYLLSKAFLTSQRIIIVNKVPTPDVWTFDIPLATMYKESAECPIFGKIYLKGSTAPYKNLLPGHCHFKLWFMGGGMDCFLMLLERCLK